VTQPPLSGARHLVNALLDQGVTHIFCVPGESYLAVLDELVSEADRIRVVTCRHEAAAANMAEAHGKLTGRPGVAFVTRGPGATHASIGVHTAFQDSTPMLLFIGQVARGDKDREAFQEVDYRAFFGPLAKWATEIEDAARVPEYVARAVSTAINGRPGPVVLALPEDMQLDVVSAPRVPLRTRVEAAPDPTALAQLDALLRQAQRPLLLLGGPGWSAQAVADIADFASRWQLPVATSFRAKDLIDNRHPCYAGDVGIGPNPALAQAVKEADVLIALGPRLGEMTTSGYSLVKAPLPDQQLVHIHCGAEEIGRVFAPALAIQASAPCMAAALAALAAPEAPAWRERTESLRAAYGAWIAPHADGEGLNLSRIFTWLDANLPEDAILCNGAGNYAGWLHRFTQHKMWKSQLAPTSGAMGYGLPAAIAAKIVAPERTVLAVAGDGCFMMASNELATAVHESAGVIVLVVNNSQYGTIRMHQERDYPGRRSATALTNPDFVAYAQSFGCHAARVTAVEEFADAFAAAKAFADRDARPALIELVTARADIAPGRKIAP
jgi:acetolactate synthase I/II/III large subunit